MLLHSCGDPPESRLDGLILDFEVGILADYAKMMEIPIAAATADGGENPRRPPVVANPDGNGMASVGKFLAREQFFRDNHAQKV